jgi:hypothetical protein
VSGDVLLPYKLGLNRESNLTLNVVKWVSKEISSASIVFLLFGTFIAGLLSNGAHAQTMPCLNVSSVTFTTSNSVYIGDAVDAVAKVTGFPVAIRWTIVTKPSTQASAQETKVVFDSTSTKISVPTDKIAGTVSVKAEPINSSCSQYSASANLTVFPYSIRDVSANPGFEFEDGAVVSFDASISPAQSASSGKYGVTWAIRAVEDKVSYGEWMQLPAEGANGERAVLPASLPLGDYQMVAFVQSGGAVTKKEKDIKKLEAGKWSDSWPIYDFKSKKADALNPVLPDDKKPVRIATYKTEIIHQPLNLSAGENIAGKVFIIARLTSWPTKFIDPNKPTVEEIKKLVAFKNMLAASGADLVQLDDNPLALKFIGDSEQKELKVVNSEEDVVSNPYFDSEVKDPADYRSHEKLVRQLAAYWKLDLGNYPQGVFPGQINFGPLARAIVNGFPQNFWLEYSFTQFTFEMVWKFKDDRVDFMTSLTVPDRLLNRVWELATDQRDLPIRAKKLTPANLGGNVCGSTCVE